MRALQTLAVAAALIAAVGTAPASAQGGGKKIEGVVASVNTFTGQITIKTNDVPGMAGKSTTVAFVAKDTMTVKKFHEGDKVVGDLVVKGSDTHVENLAVKK